jgi:L-lactate dehydrogenase complex protein LldG
VIGGRTGGRMGIDTATAPLGSARVEILRRIRAATGGASNPEVARAGWTRLPREYRRAASRGREAVLELLVDRLRDYDANVVRVGRDGLSAIVAKMLSERGKTRMVVPTGIAKEWLPIGVEFVEDEDFSAAELDLMA